MLSVEVDLWTRRKKLNFVEKLQNNLRWHNWRIQGSTIVTVVIVIVWDNEWMNEWVKVMMKSWLKWRNEKTFVFVSDENIFKCFKMTKGCFEFLSKITFKNISWVHALLLLLLRKFKSLVAWILFLVYILSYLSLPKLGLGAKCWQITPGLGQSLRFRCWEWNSDQNCITLKP